jgi:ethanolamine utilization protein
MNTDSLINIITEEVLKRITMLSSQNLKEKSKSILILDSISNQNKHNYDEITSKWNDTKFLDDYCHEDGVDSFDYIIVPKLSNNDLVNIAIGDSKSEAAEIILDGIFKGKKVIVLEEGICYRKFKNTANENFFNMFKGYEKKIISFGIEIVRKKDLITCLDNGSYKEKIKDHHKEEINKALEQEETIEEGIITKKVICEKDIEKLWNKGYGTITINKKSIITPLAKDFIKTNEINIKF